MAKKSLFNVNYEDTRTRSLLASFLLTLNRSLPLDQKSTGNIGDDTHMTSMKIVHFQYKLIDHVWLSFHFFSFS